MTKFFNIILWKLVYIPCLILYFGEAPYPTWRRTAFSLTLLLQFFPVCGICLTHARVSLFNFIIARTNWNKYPNTGGATFGRFSVHSVAMHNWGRLVMS